MGRELVRIDQDARRRTSAGCAASWATTPPRRVTCTPFEASAFASPARGALEGESLRLEPAAGAGLVLLLAIVAFAVPLASAPRALDDEVRSSPAPRPTWWRQPPPPLLAPARHGQSQALADATSNPVRGRVLIVDASGTVLADSAGPGRTGANYSRAPGDHFGPCTAGATSRNRHSGHAPHEDLLVTAAPGGCAAATGDRGSEDHPEAWRRSIARSDARSSGLALIACGRALAGGWAAGWLIARSARAAR